MTQVVGDCEASELASEEMQRLRPGAQRRHRK